MLSRRRLLTYALSAGAMTTLGVTACRREPPREHALRTLVDEVVTEQLLALDAASRTLADSVARLRAEPVRTALDVACEDFVRAVTAWKAASSFELGPFAELRARPRILYWPVRAETVERVLADTAPLDGARVEQLGVESRGLYALEYLLFGKDRDAALRVLRENPRAALFAELLAGNAAGTAREMVTRLRAGAGYASAFAAAGHASLSGLVVGMGATLEGLYERPLRLALWLADLNKVDPAQIEGWGSGVSSSLVAAALEGTERLYVGGQSGGLSALVARTAPSSDARARAAFREAVAIAKSLPAPVEALVLSDRARVERLAASVRRAEVLLKTEIVNALGVSLSFGSHDGD